MADSIESNRNTDRSRLWRLIAIVINGLAVVVVAVLMLQFGTSEENSARVRNSLIAKIGQAEDLRWAPDRVPDSFAVEHSAPSEQIAGVAERLLSDPQTRSLADFGKAKLLARHLAGNRQSQSPIQSNTTDAYRRIVDKGEGYCADYSQVFTALALAADVPVREWGLAWSGFGFGHTFNEIFDRDLNKWVFIDSFHSMTVVDAGTGIPLSALEFQSRLRMASKAANIRVVPLFEDRFYFKTQEEALEYYARGADQFFVFWGNDVFSYDSNATIKILAGLPRAVEVMAAILLGVHPSIRVIETATNARQIESLFRTRRIFLTYFGLFVAGSGLLVVQIWLYFRTRRSFRRPESLEGRFR